MQAHYYFYFSLLLLVMEGLGYAGYTQAALCLGFTPGGAQDLNWGPLHGK